MPHQNIPESWVDWVFSGIAAMVIGLLAWIARVLFGRFELLEQRVQTLERAAAVVALVSDERHRTTIERLDRIDAVTDRIDDKLDRLIERAR